MSSEANILASLPAFVIPRRAVLYSIASLGAGLGNLAGASQRSPRSAEVTLLNAALALEHQAIAAYDIGIGTGLLKADALDIARHFQSQHRAHRELLVSEIRKLGGTPVAALETYTFKGKDDRPVEFKTAADVLVLALGLEAGATSAYLGFLPQLTSKALLSTMAGVACDEAQHAAAIRLLLRQQPAPDAIVR